MVHVSAPCPSDGVGGALRSAFAGGSGMPAEITALLARLDRAPRNNH